MDAVYARSSICESSTSFFGGWAEGTVFTFNSAKSTKVRKLDEPSAKQEGKKKGGFLGRLKEWIDKDKGTKRADDEELKALLDYWGFKTRQGAGSRENQPVVVPTDDFENRTLASPTETEPEESLVTKEAKLATQAGNSAGLNEPTTVCSEESLPSTPLSCSDASVPSSFISFKDLVNDRRCERKKNQDALAPATSTGSKQLTTTVAEEEIMVEEKPTTRLAEKEVMVEGKVLKVYGGCVSVVNPDGMHEAMIISNEGSLKLLQNVTDSSLGTPALQPKTKQFNVEGLPQHNQPEHRTSVRPSTRGHSKKTATKLDDANADIPKSNKPKFKSRHRSSTSNGVTYRALFGKKVVYEPVITQAGGSRRKRKQKKQHTDHQAGSRIVGKANHSQGVLASYASTLQKQRRSFEAAKPQEDAAKNLRDHSKCSKPSSKSCSSACSSSQLCSFPRQREQSCSDETKSIAALEEDMLLAFERGLSRKVSTADLASRADYGQRPEPELKVYPGDRPHTQLSKDPKEMFPELKYEVKALATPKHAAEGSDRGGGQTRREEPLLQHQSPSTSSTTQEGGANASKAEPGQVMQARFETKGKEQVDKLKVGLSYSVQEQEIPRQCAARSSWFKREAARSSPRNCFMEQQIRRDLHTSDGSVRGPGTYASSSDLESSMAEPRESCCRLPHFTTYASPLAQQFHLASGEHFRSMNNLRHKSFHPYDYPMQRTPASNYGLTNCYHVPCRRYPLPFEERRQNSYRRPGTSPKTSCDCCCSPRPGALRNNVLAAQDRSATPSLHWLTEEEVEIILRIRHALGKEGLSSHVNVQRHLAHIPSPRASADSLASKRPSTVGGRDTGPVECRQEANSFTRSPLQEKKNTTVDHGHPQELSRFQAEEAAVKIQNCWRRRTQDKCRLHRAARKIQRTWREYLKSEEGSKKLPKHMKRFYSIIKKRRINKFLVPPSYEKFVSLVRRIQAATEGARLRRRLKSRRVRSMVKEIKEICLFLDEASKESPPETSPRLLSQLASQLQQMRLQLDTALNCPGKAAKFLLRRCPATPILLNAN